MGIYAPGITKPDHCCNCQFCEDSTDDCLLQNDAHWSTYSEQIKNCPLIEIPEPHGNLIDADEFAEGIMHEAEQYWGLLKPETREMVQSVCKDIRNYPVIIGREDGENHDD